MYQLKQYINMSAAIETNTTQMETNKRTASSDLRQQFIKKQKNMAQKWTSVDVPQAIDVAGVKVRLQMPRPLVELNTDIAMVKRRNGEFYPKLFFADGSVKKNVQFLLPNMVVKFQDLGKEGNLGKFKNNDPNKAKFQVSLEMGCPEELETLMPSLVGEQTKFFNELKRICNSHMETAFHHDSHTWTKAKNDKELEDFVSGANYSCIKTVRDDNDDEYEIVSMARRLTTFQGAPNNPTFWKVDEKGEFEEIEPAYIPKGSLIQCTGTLRSYNVNPEMYGVSMDLGENIIVVWMPPKKKSTPVEETSVPSVPFISFDY